MSNNDKVNKYRSSQRYYFVFYLLQYVFCKIFEFFDNVLNAQGMRTYFVKNRKNIQKLKNKYISHLNVNDANSYSFWLVWKSRHRIIHANPDNFSALSSSSLSLSVYRGRTHSIRKSRSQRV